VRHCWRSQDRGANPSQTLLASNGLQTLSGKQCGTPIRYDSVHRKQWHTNRKDAVNGELIYRPRR
jgi:hypothetical protein